MEIKNFTEFKKLVYLSLEEDLWSMHSFDGTVVTVKGNLYDVQPDDVILPLMTNLYMLGGLAYPLLVGSKVNCNFTANGQAFIVGDLSLTSSEPTDFVPLGTPLQSFLTALKTSFDTHTHVESGSTTAVPVPLSPPLPSPLLSNSVKVKL